MNLKRAEEASAVNCIAWILANNFVNENNSPIEFLDHKFLIEPYLDNTPKQAICKAAQIGWSTLAILRSFHLAKYAKANIIHTFPSQSMSKDFVVPKVNPLISNNKTLKKMMGVDTASLKQVEDRYIYYRGSFEQTEAISISAHILIQDEFDRSNQNVLKTYRSRLDDVKRERPELGWEWQFSNPSIPGAGVDVWFQRSDQKHWFIKCKKCRKQQYMRFPDNICFERKLKVCSKCKKEITPDDLRNGRWVYKHENRKISGYWISQMMIPWITAEKIIEDSMGDQDIFHNFVLGLPYVSKDTALTREAIIGCLSPGYNPRTNVAIGVDNGKEKTYIIGNKYGIFDMGVTEDWEEIERLRNRFNALMVIDSLPYPHTPRKLAEKYPGKVFVHYYREDTKRAGIIRWDGEVVKSDRTKIIDSVVADFNAKDVTINMTENKLEEFITHWKQMYRMIKLTPQGIKKPVWETIEGRADHLAHATVYWRIALEQTLGLGTIASPDGPRQYGKHPVANPDQTVPALDLEAVAKKTGKKRQTWKTI